MKVTVRMWTATGYHKDVALLDDQQVRMYCQGMEAKTRHFTTPPIDAVRVVVDPRDFPEAVEFEIIVEKTR